MRTLNRKLSKSSDEGSATSEKPSLSVTAEKEGSGSTHGADKLGSTGSDKAPGGKPPTGKGETDVEEIREKFRIVKVSFLCAWLLGQHAACGQQSMAGVFQQGLKQHSRLMLGLCIEAAGAGACYGRAELDQLESSPS